MLEGSDWQIPQGMQDLKGHKSARLFGDSYIGREALAGKSHLI
jgi:hypothetical protein